MSVEDGARFLIEDFAVFLAPVEDDVAQRHRPLWQPNGCLHCPFRVRLWVQPLNTLRLALSFRKKANGSIPGIDCVVSGRRTWYCCGTMTQLPQHCISALHTC